MKIKVYPCCALTHAPPADIEQINRLKAVLEEVPRVEILHFLGFPNPPGTLPGDIYRRDILDCVRRAEVLLAIYLGNVTSDGRGYEIATAVEKYGKPVIVVHHRDSVVTHLITDLVVVRPELVSLHSYDNLLEDVPGILAQRLKELWPERFADQATAVA